MRNLSNELKNKMIDYNKLLKYGFILENKKYIFKNKVLDNQFEVNIEIENNNAVSYIIDLDNDEEYIVVDIKSTLGEFASKVKEEYENLINDVITNCTTKNVFKNKQSKKIIEYVKNKYNSDLEFLWKKYDDTAVIRNKNNNKWYGIIFSISKKVLGDYEDELVEIMDIRADNIDKIIDNKNIYPGYHMNKKSWITILLDNKLDDEYILNLIDNSYNLSFNKSELLAKKVYDYLLLIPKGKVVTYGQIAKYLGNIGLSRVVGNILHKNPDGDKYPCYKVLNNKGELAEKFVFGGKNVQRERLEKDGIVVENNKVNLDIYQWK